MAQRESFDSMDGGQRCELVPFSRREPLGVKPRRDTCAIVKELDALARRDRTVVIALHEHRLALPQQRERLRRIRTVPHGIAGDPEGIHLPERSENGFERDEIGVDVGEEAYAHAAFASASVKRRSRNARPITTDAAPQRASARTSATSRTPP